MMIFNPDSLRTQVEAATGGRVTVLYDDKGYPSYMHVIPKFRYEDLGMEAEMGTGVATAFMKDGQEKSEIFISQYQASLYDGRAVSLPGKDPRTSINYDAAKAACVNKGPGWHLMNVHEWAAIALWCKANGFEPRGNTDWGRAHNATHEVAVRPDGGTPGNTDGTGRTATGGGPASWRHDGQLTGIADLVGNVHEWQDLLKIVDGRVFAVPENRFDEPETGWVDTGVDLPTMSASAFNGLTIAGTELTNRLLITHAGIDLQGSVWANSEDERFPIRGGSWNNGSDAGLAALGLDNSRAGSGGGIGFRPAFVS